MTLARRGASPRGALARAACAAAMVALVTSYACAARAQAGGGVSRTETARWIVVPSTTGEVGNPAHAARAAARELTNALEARGARVLRAEESKRLFEQRGSVPPIAIQASDVDALARDAQQALYHIATGLQNRAQADVARAMERARKALESLNRETRAARHLLDACMFLVRGHVDRGEREKARAQALECRRLVPDIEPDATIHPPTVIGVLAEAEAELLTREPSALRIESHPAGCAVLVNGRNLGTTPKELARLSSGEYRVQVECNDGEPGRVHRVVLAGNRAVARVDTRFDRVVQTAFDLSLRYGSGDEERDGVVRDALEAARTVGASEVVVTTLGSAAGAGAAVVEATRYRVVDGARIASVMLALDDKGKPDAAALEGASRALLEAAAPPETVALSHADSESESGTSPATSLHAMPAASGAVTSGEGFAAQDDGSAWRTVGYVAGGAGVLANLVGWGLYVQHAGLQDDYSVALDTLDTTRFDAYREVGDFDIVPSVVLGSGAGVLALSMPLWLPDEPGVPWWSWLAGGAGVIAAGSGVALASQAGGCERDGFGRCTEPQLATRLGTLLLLQSVPLLSVPIVYGVRALTGERLEGRLEVRGEHAMQLVVGGRW